MLDVLEKHLNGGDASVCIVARWIDGLKEEEKQAFLRIKENSQTIHVASLFADLNKSTSLPFKLTAFRSHLRGYCTCQK